MTLLTYVYMYWGMTYVRERERLRLMNKVINLKKKKIVKINYDVIFDQYYLMHEPGPISKQKLLEFNMLASGEVIYRLW